MSMTTGHRTKQPKRGNPFFAKENFCTYYLWLGILSLIVSSPVYGQTTPEKTLSPYFFVEQGDPEVDRLPLKATDVQVNIVGTIADVVVSQTYENQGTRPINAKYIFPASIHAAVHGMTMTVGERRIRAQIKEKEAAQKAFDLAKKEGKTASLLKQHRPNVFSMNLANILPGDIVVVELKYTEFLQATDGTYEFSYPTVVGPRFSDTPESEATDSNSWVKSPYLKQGVRSSMIYNITTNVSMPVPLQEISSSTHEVDVIWQADDQALIELKPSEKDAGTKDYIVRYRLRDREIMAGAMLYEGKEENFFILTAEPPERVELDDIPPREYIFVVDVSGSMHGFPLEISKSLLRDLIGNLRQTDMFNVILFSGDSNLLSPRSLPATQQNLQSAISVIDNQSGGGGTQLLSAVQTSMEMPYTEGYSRNIVVVTDGYISAEADVFHYIRQHLDKCNVFAFGIGSSVNRHLIEGIATAGMGEPFVVTSEHEARNVAAKLREYIEAPVLTDVKVQFSGIDAYNVQPEAQPDLLANRPLVVYGKYRGAANGKVIITGKTGRGEFRREISLRKQNNNDGNEALKYLWARKSIAEIMAMNPYHGESEVRDEIVSLGLAYSLLTPYTSFVAIDEIVRSNGDVALNVQQPNPLPKGVSNYAVGARGAPEPEFYLILLMAVGFGLVLVRRSKVSEGGDIHAKS